MTTEPLKREGVVLDMPEGEYHGGPELSSSAAKALLESPRHYNYLYNSGAKRVEKKAWDIGTAAHALVLGTGAPTVAIPEKVLAANGAASTAAARKFIADARADGLTPVKQAEFDEIKRMADAVLTHQEAGRLLEREHWAEASMFARDAEFDLDLRCRFDWLETNLREAGDLKTIDNVNRHAVAYAVKKWRYHVQDAFYRRVAAWLGITIEKFPFVFVQKAPPYDVVVYDFDRDLQEMGRTEVAEAMRRLNEARETGYWPGLSDTRQTLAPSVGHIYDFQDEYETEF